MTAPLALACLLALTAQAGCACSRGPGKRFDPGRDVFAFRNELKWEYAFDASGVMTARETRPAPDYALRCFPMVRAAREFFYHAEFRPDLPAAEPDEYRARVRAVIRRNSRCPAPEGARIVIPGFHDLREFSGAHGALIQAEAGGAWRSFFQRGNWRMVFPSTRAGRERMAARFLAELARERLPVAHIYRFPDTSLNHALLLWAAEETPGQVVFQAYDPNEPDRPARLIFDRAAGAFLFERNRYFGGGPVRVYEVYRGIAF